MDSGREPVIDVPATLSARVKIGDGNVTQDELLEPTQERLLALEPGARVLDIGCEAGRFARRMAAAGAQVVTFDQSERFIGRARQRTNSDLSDRIDYRVLDATDPGHLAGLELNGPFDAAVCTMALTELPRLSLLAASLNGLLVPGGRFVFSVRHPVFNSGDAQLVGESHRVETGMKIRLGVRVRDYAVPRPFQAVGISGQSSVQTSFHRPIGMLLDAFFDAGFMADRLVEATVPETVEAAPSALSWRNLKTIPQVLVCRLRRP